MKTILIIGGTGYIGEYVTNFLKKHKGLDLIVIHKSEPVHNKVRGVHYYKLNLSEKKLKLPPKLAQFDAIIILTKSDKSIMNNICRVILPQAKKIIFASSILVYPSRRGKITEKVSPKPVTVYEKNKIFEENILARYAKKNRIPLIVARLANVYGDIKNKGVVSKIFETMQKNQEFKMNRFGNKKKDYIFIEDAAEFLCRLVLIIPRSKKEIYNVCTGKGYSMLELISLIEKIIEKKLAYTFYDGKKNKQFIVGENKKIVETTGYHPHDIMSGLKKTYNNFASKNFS
ncbi:MAG: NAD-dependent epimerase/dehydratase [Parcubacteria group bacterium GW2011_GWA2_38_13]|nr:MAG: NAD-dependent epimerase/dehydratase [Parcubacteria group bacterium GW2011_GWA2_38_13]